MKRLTDNEFHTREEKENVNYIGESRLKAIYDKTFDLEDIEEKLGIDLITLFKAYYSGFYIKYEDGFIGFIRGGEYYLEVGLETKCFIVKEFEPNGTKWYFRDYSKTWALTKEELL